MPKLAKYMGKAGTTYSNGFVSTPMCSPGGGPRSSEKEGEGCKYGGRGAGGSFNIALKKLIFEKGKIFKKRTEFLQQTQIF